LEQAANKRAVARLLQAEPGRPLSPAIRARMEGQFGLNFSAVRIHAGPEAADAARSLSAKAFTVGSHIGFSSGRYAPGTRVGHRLLSHELAHVVQQSRRGTAQPTTDGRGPVESDAQEAAARAEGGGPVPVAGASAVGVAADPEQEESWLDRAKAGLSRASAAARAAYEDPKAAWQEVKDKAKETYSEAKDTYHEYAGKADAYATAAKTAWDASPVKQVLQAGADDKTIAEQIADSFEAKQPPASDTSPRAKMIRSAGKIMKASAYLNSEPRRAAMKRLLEGHPIDAIKAAQDTADKGLKDIKEATFDTINKWEDGEFDAESKPMVDPATHPTLAKIEHGADVGSKWVDKRTRQVVGGAAKAVFSMAEGIDSALLHPLNTVEGLGKISENVSPLPSMDTLRELGRFGKDMLDPSVSSKDALKNLGKAEEQKQQQSLDMLKGLGKNYIEAAGGEIVPPVDQQTDDQKQRFAGKKPGEVSWSGWSQRERLGEIPGLAAVDIGSFFIGGGEANAAARTTSELGVVSKLGEVSDATKALGALEHGAPAGDTLAHTGDTLAHAGDLGEGVKATPKPVDLKPPQVGPTEQPLKSVQPLEPPTNIKSARGPRFGPKQRKALAQAPTGVDTATPLRDAKAEPIPEQIPDEVPAEVPADVEDAVPEAAGAEGRGPRRQAPTAMAGGAGPKPKLTSVKPGTKTTGPSGPGRRGSSHAPPPASPRSPVRRLADVKELPNFRQAIGKVPPGDALKFFNDHIREYPRPIRDAIKNAKVGDVGALEDIDRMIKKTQAEIGNEFLGYPAEANPKNAKGELIGEPQAPFETTTKGHALGNEGTEFEGAVTLDRKGRPKNLTYEGRTKSGERLQIDDVDFPTKTAKEIKMPLAIKKNPRFFSQNLGEIVDQMRRQGQFAKDWGFTSYKWEMYSYEDVLTARKAKSVLARNSPELAEKIEITTVF
jgi:hypothetical protein